MPIYNTTVHNNNTYTALNRIYNQADKTDDI